jgi:hypothetical protein
MYACFLASSRWQNRGGCVAPAGSCPAALVHEFLDALVLVMFDLHGGHLFESQQKPVHSLIFWNDQFGTPGAADDEGGVRGRVEGVERADCPGRVLRTGRSGGRTESDIVPVPGDYSGRSGSEPEAIGLCGSEWK